MAHAALVAEAKEAIQRVISDTSVDREQTLESLDELGSDIDAAETAIREDMESEE